MGWLRSNWLDALIFLLVAVIMAGVIFFLTGVNPLSALQGGSQNPPVAVTPTPQTPQPTPTPTPQPKPEVKPTPKPEAKPQPQPEPEPVVTILPVPKAPQETKPVPAPPKIEDKPETKPAQPAQPAPAPTPTPQPASKPQAVSLGADTAGAYRVAVGSFANADNAARLMQTLRSQGYPATIETAGSLTRVWVGPYRDAAKARAVAATLSKYQPQLARKPAQPTQPAQSTQPAQPGQAAGATPAKYLQVGAFRSAASAQPVVEKVREAGYPVVLVEGGGFVRVRVGPLDNPSEAASALRAKGLDVLEVR